MIVSKKHGIIKTQIKLKELVKKENYKIDDLEDKESIFLLYKSINKKYTSDKLIEIILDFHENDYSKPYWHYVNSVVPNYNKEQYLIYLEFRKNNSNVANTDDFYKAKYGEHWVKYKSECLDKRANPYDINYIMEKYNISEEEAKLKVEKFKKDKATSLEGFIKRNGEEKGKELFAKFQETSSLKLENLQKKYGKELGIQKKEEYNLKNKLTNKRCIEYWLKLGYSLEDSKKLQSEFQIQNSGVHLYYLQKKYGKEQGLIEYKKINKTKGFTVKQFMDKYGIDDGYIKYLNKVNKCRETLIKKGLAIQIELKKKYEEYCRLVDLYTNINLSLYGNNKLGENWKELRGRYSNHIDHKISKFYGFNNGVLPYIIGHIENLELLNSSLNCSKSLKCSMELDTLYEKIKKHENKINKKIK